MTTLSFEKIYETLRTFSEVNKKLKAIVVSDAYAYLGLFETEKCFYMFISKEEYALIHETAEKNNVSSVTILGDIPIWSGDGIAYTLVTGKPFVKIANYYDITGA